MSIKDFKKFLEDNKYREDEHSHLNDDLNSRWDDSTYDPYDDDDDNDKYPRSYGDEGDDYLYGRPNHTSKSTFRDDDFDEDDDIEMDDVEHLLYLLRSMFKNSGIEVEVEHKNLDIMIYCVMSRKERLKDLINVFGVATKLKKDILPQYDSEFEMWETKTGQPMLVFYFYYGEGLGDDNIPF